MHCVDLGESFPTNSNEYLLAKIGVDTAENTSLSKFGGKFNSLSIRPLTGFLPAGGDGRYVTAGAAVAPRRVPTAFFWRFPAAGRRLSWAMFILTPS